MNRFLLFFFLVIIFFSLVILHVFDNWVRRPEDPRLPAAVITSQWAETINNAATKFYVDHVEIKG